MNIEFIDCILLAAEKNDQPQGDALGNLFLTIGIPMLIVFLLFQMTMGNPQRREKKRQEEMLKELKKNDRVITIGGIIGTVANVAPDFTEVTIKVDDNTRLKMQGSSIRSRLNDESGDDSSKAKST